MADRKVLTKAFTHVYRSGSKKERGRMLDEFVAACGYTRSYASWILRSHGKRVQMGDRVRIIGDAKVKIERQRARTYGFEVVSVLKQIWKMADYPWWCQVRICRIDDVA